MAYMQGGGGGAAPRGGGDGFPNGLGAASAASALGNNSSGTSAFGNIGLQQLQEALLQQQLSQQMAAQSQQSNLLQQLLASSLLGQVTQAPTIQPPANNNALNVLQAVQNQMLLSQLLNQQAATVPGNPLSLLNPVSLYYQQVAQQLLGQQPTQQLVQPVAVQPAAITLPPAAASNPLLQQLAQAAQVPNLSVENHVEQQKKLLESILRGADAATSLGEQTASSSQNTAPPQPPVRPAAVAPPSAPRPPHLTPISRTNSGIDARAAHVAARVDPESVEDHISRLISENEAIVEPEPMLLKRRPYHRQIEAQSSIDDNSTQGSARTSPGIRGKAHPIRSQSLFELGVNKVRTWTPSEAVRQATGGSLTSGQPLVRGDNNSSSSLSCSFCSLQFPNEPGLLAHEKNCSRRVDVEAQPTPVQQSPRQIPFHVQSSSSSSSTPTESASRHPLKRKLLAAAIPEPVKHLKVENSPEEVIVIGDSPQRIAHPTPTREPVHIGGSITQGIPPTLPRRATIAAIPFDKDQAFQQAVTAKLQEHLAPTTSQAAPPPPPAPAPPPPAPPAPAAPVLPKKEELEKAFHITEELSGRADRPYYATYPLSESHRRAAVHFGVKIYPPGFEFPPPVPYFPPNTSRVGDSCTPTMLCSRTLPMFVQQSSANDTMYQVYKPPDLVDSIDARLNILYMGSVCARPPRGDKVFWKYTTADTTEKRLTTHSTFFESSQRLRLRECRGEDVANDLHRLFFPDQPKRVIIEPKKLVEVSEVEMEEDSHTTGGTPDSHEDKENLVEMTTDTKMSIDTPVEEVPKMAIQQAKREPVIGGYRTDEVYVYVRGRGRGRYVCDRCGIRCKKPSMLKKHIKSHTDVRPYQCTQCNFSFKTKGNLTKHLASKAHRRKSAKSGMTEDDLSEDEDRLIIDDDPEREMDIDIMDRSDDENEEDDFYPENMNENMPTYHKFGQENILVERGAHTPPSRWMLVEEEGDSKWPEKQLPSSFRRCSSAPPSSMHYPPPPIKEKKRPPSIHKTDEKPAVASESSSMSLSESALPSLAAYPTRPSFVPPVTSLGNYFADSQEFPCVQCTRIFRKASDLSLHQHTHNLERTKPRLFPCPECRLGLRTKIQLQRHVEINHPTSNQTANSQLPQSPVQAKAANLPQIPISLDMTSSAHSLLAGIPVASNPRSFLCTDCNIGFRKHGILAKHLRSKTHVMKLETLKKLPEDSLTLITKKDNGACLNDVDTSDCERARTSLIAIVELLRSEEMAASGAAPPLMPTTTATPSRTSLECHEQLLHSPPAPSPRRSISGSSNVSASEESRRRLDTLLADAANSRVLTGNVWTPPRVEDALGRTQPAPPSAESNGALPTTSASVDVERSFVRVNGLPPVMALTHKCNICDNQYDSSIDFQIHMLTDHVIMRDGRDLKCPKAHCDKVYPHKEALRNHLAAHYLRTSPEGRDSVSSTPSMLNVPNSSTRDGVSSPSGSESTCPSPASLRISDDDPPKTSSAPPTSFPCSLCSVSFSDTLQLQSHWLSHVTKRPHVCSICDAGFTTAEQLESHRATH